MMETKEIKQDINSYEESHLLDTENLSSFQSDNQKENIMFTENPSNEIIILKNRINELLYQNEELLIKLRTMEHLINEKGQSQNSSFIQVIRKRLLEKCKESHDLEVEKNHVFEEYEKISDAYVVLMKQEQENSQKIKFFQEETKRLNEELISMSDEKSQFETAISLKDQEILRLTKLINLDQSKLCLSNQLKEKDKIIVEYQQREKASITKDNLKKKNILEQQYDSFYKINCYLKSLHIIERINRTISTPNQIFVHQRLKKNSEIELIIFCSNPQVKFVLIHEVNNLINNQFISGAMLVDGICSIYCSKGIYHICGYCDSLHNIVCKEITL
ncbi:hypothetical protein EHI8A_053140 [Entamoeba histolytica HM-1:IMSS-B]|uniref:Uncharacterized protein n=4 Tax=Entamoeba histolytica TaxID=5759 RepID=C4M6T6_ENTH1|nr:hypothetical protein EHI_054220 [Entamoeba histolytica HM-1:IMSS]EAL46017.1 hypothetical protein EHI_054220 [Entamoeba histolytica HM-1:IMSS]EMH76167.1 hypothetical protein EHI8A_053140 [Entamoeba histolytica HM-1:IMSS-B]ENY65087.1 hypothetical protein EHI7A_053690 [Entamoeba histolytica HM-1:IMSS-A]GAT97223.1 hypothetical protein CL6EHI_054220 [Entamoeba histolytica]|eukprot:XP_651403.1 hypothetical protein EHI_054220 [Entamoeba histolytica HM-1:IMSS]